MIDQEFIEGVKEHVDEMIDLFLGDDPDADVPAIAFMVSESRGLGVVPLEHMMIGELGKDFVGNIGLPVAIEMMGDVEAIALVTTAWQAQAESPEEMESLRERYGGQVSKYPNRIEVVFVSFGFRDGRLITCSREITRIPDSPPDVGEWEEMEASPWAGNSGRMMDAAMEKLTGRKLISQAQVLSASRVLAMNDHLTEEMEAMLLERGFDVNAKSVDELDEDERAQFERAVAELPLEFHAKMMANIMEHLPEFGEAQYEEALRREEQSEDRKRASLADEIRERWIRGD